MKIPKYILIALQRRANAAYLWNKYDWIISNYINKHNIEVPSECYRGGVEGIVNPDSANKEIIKCMLEHENESNIIKP